MNAQEVTLQHRNQQILFNISPVTGKIIPALLDDSKQVKFTIPIPSTSDLVIAFYESKKFLDEIS